MIIQRKSLIAALCLVILMTALSILPAKTYADGSSIDVELSTVVNSDFLGIGAEYDPFDFMTESVGGGFNDNWWEVEKLRLKKVHPQLVRVWYQPEWLEPVNDNSDPNTINWSGMQTNGDRMQAMYRVLDFLKEEQIDVVLIAGLVMDDDSQSWMSFPGLSRPELSAPNDLDEWAEWVSASLQQLITNKGYDNIKYVMSYNEPNGAGFTVPSSLDEKTYYKQMYEAIDARLTADGLRSQVKLVGPDETGALDWTQFAADNMDDVLDIYDGHAYNQTFDSMADWVSDRLDAVDPTGKPFMATEYAPIGSEDFRRSYQYGVDLADLTISGMRNQASAMMYWRLSDQYIPTPYNYIDDAAYGTWRWLPYWTAPEYSYYAFSLLTHYSDAHAQVLSTDSDDPDLHVTTVKRPDGNYSVFVVNSSPTAGKNVTVHFSSAINKTVSRHLYTSGITPTANANLIPADTVWNSVGSAFTDMSLPANSFAVYTTVPEPAQIQIGPDDVPAALGAQVNFSHSLLGGGSGGVTWSVVGGSAYGTIDSNGVYTAPTVMPAMPQAIVKATSTANPEVYNLAVVRLQVTGLAATGRDTLVKLNWQPSLGATSYKVKRGNAAAGPFTTVASGVTGTAYNDTGLTNGTTYYYVVSAVNSYGESGNSRVMAGSPTSNSMSDDFASGTIDPSKWTVISKGLRSNEDPGLTATVTGGALHIAGTTGVNYWGGRSLQSVPQFYATPDSPLTVEVDRLSLSGSGTGFRSALWLYAGPSQYIHFSQNGEFGVWGFNKDGGGDTRVWTNNDSGNHRMKLVHDGSAVHFFVDGVEYASTPVSWNTNMRVILTGEATAIGNTVSTAFDNVSIAPAPASMPAAPTALTGTAGNAQVGLSWTPSPDAASYTVKRRTTVGQPYVTVATGVTQTTYTDTGLVNGTTYDYVVAAVSAGGTSVHSNSVTVKPAVNDIFLDNGTAEYTGTWGRSTSLPNYYGADYSAIASGTGANSVRWRPNLPEEGDYEVYYWLPDGQLTGGYTDRATNAPFTVHYDGGSQTYLVNEQPFGGNWILLGEHHFAAGTAGYVELTDNANGGHVIADAIKFHKVDD